MDKKQIAEEILNQIDCMSAHKSVHFKDEKLKGMFIILRLITRSPQKMIAGDIARLLNVSTARVAVALKTLKNRNYITTYKDPLDARKTIVEITQEGKEALNIREKNIIEMIAYQLEMLSDEEILQFQNIIKKLFAHK